MVTSRQKSEILRAARAFADFHGEDPETVEIKGKIPETYFRVGKIRAITYEVIEDGKEVVYHHDFDKPAALLVSFDGKAALTVGGQWRFTNKGFEG